MAIEDRLMPYDSQHYFPLLKGRKGELDALAQVDGLVRDSLTPLVEFVPAAEEDQAVIGAGIDRLIERIASTWGTADRILLDVGRVDAEAMTGTTAVAELLASARSHQVHAVPVLRLSDSAALVRAVRAAHAADGRGGCIRVQGDDLQEDPEDLAVWLRSVWRELDISPEDLDLILDFGAVADDATGGLAAFAARQILRHLPELVRWRSVSVAAGAFPADLSGLSAWILGEVPRRDAALWRSVAAAGPPRVPSFGDYAVGHPLLVTGVPFAPPPQLRYAAADRWLVLKGSRRDQRGNSQFFDICAAIAERPEFTAGLGWADGRIVAAATRQGGPGNGSTWRSIGTGHHMDLVVERLRTRNEP